MSFSATGARRPLQSKPKQNPFLKRASSAFDKHARTKANSSPPPAKRAKTAPSRGGDDESLEQMCIATSLHKPGSQDVKSLMEYVRTRTFSELPNRAAGMNSTMTVKILNFQRDLVPLVSVAHLHALSKSATSTDREIAELMQQGVLGKISIPGRGRGGAPIGDAVVLISDWKKLVNKSGLDECLQGKYLSLLTTQPMTSTASASEFSMSEVSQLVAAGLCTSTSALSSAVTMPYHRTDPQSPAIHVPIAEAGTLAPTGSHEAVGGIGAVHLPGGGSGGLPSGAGSLASQRRAVGNLTFSLPGTGAYLKLLTEAQNQLLQLLAKSSPRHREALRSLLRERWDGNMAGGDAASRAKRARGEFAGVLPGQTKKWKTFHGLSFDWVLEECLGGGLVECFDTGSVGLGVRAVR